MRGKVLLLSTAKGRTNENFHCYGEGKTHTLTHTHTHTEFHFVLAYSNILPFDYDKSFWHFMQKTKATINWFLAFLISVKYTTSTMKKTIRKLSEGSKRICLESSESERFFSELVWICHTNVSFSSAQVYIN